MIKLAKVISTKIDSVKRRLIKILRLGNKDIQTPFEASPFGLDSVAIKDLIAIQVETGEKGKTVIIGYINKNAIAEIGEYRTYSTDSEGNEKNYIWLRNDGVIEIGGDADNMVRFSKLEEAFNDLRSDYNDLVTKWNTFAVAYIPGSPAVQGLPPTAASGNLSTADISPAKIEEIKTS